MSRAKMTTQTRRVIAEDNRPGSRPVKSPVALTLRNGVATLAGSTLTETETAMDVKAFLKTIPEFEQLPDADVDLMARLAKVGEAKAGSMVDVQGEPATKFYILVSGRLGVVLELDFGVAKKNYMVTSVGPGQMFAYSGLVGNPHYTAGSRAMANSTYLEFDVAKLDAAFNEDPRLGHVMMKMVAQTIASRLRAMQLQLAQQYAVSEAESSPD
jgi:CRP-like cAMP-binding protein